MRYVTLLAFLGGWPPLVGCGLQADADRGAQKIERPASVVPNDLENRYIVDFDERQEYELQGDLTVEATESGIYDGSGTLSEEVVEAGKTVDVVYVHAETPSSDKVT